MHRFVSDSVQQLRPSGIRRYFDIAATMDDVISLSIGEPSFTTPQHIMDAGINSLQAGQTGYTSNAGMLELREAIAKQQARRYGVSYSADNEVLVTVGVSEALWLAMKAILNPGDEVLVVEPCFVANSAAVEMAGGVPVTVPTYVENEFQVTGADLEARMSSRTKAILLSYPNNPTGAILSDEHLYQVADVAEHYDLVVISDEIYERLVYEGEHTCFASLDSMRERTIVLSGVSKSYAMTGWRIGYAMAPEPLISAMKKLHQYLIMSAPTMGQVSALQAIEHGESDVMEMVESYDQRRRIIVDGLNDLGLTCFNPGGSFYAFADISTTGLSDEEFCEQLLLDQQVAVIPGSAFGASGTGFIRISYTNNEDNLKEALKRIAEFIQKQQKASHLEAIPA